MDYLKILLLVIILIVRLRMIFNVPKLVMHMTPQQVQCIQTLHIDESLPELVQVQVPVLVLGKLWSLQTRIFFGDKLH